MTKKKHIFVLLLTATLLGLVVVGFLFWKAARTADRIHIDSIESRPASFESLASVFPGKEQATLDGEENGRINILLLGRAGERYPGKNLTDTVMLASIDMENRRIGFLSLPRDLYVPIPETNLHTKLNSLYQHSLSEGSGAEKVISAVEAITGQEIPYFVVLDFDGFEKVIDDIGGIRIFSERDILDTRYPGKNYSYETFELPAGWHTLNGKTALKYARERHSDPEGDFGRAKRQQQIIKATQEKVFSAGTILNPFTINRLLETLGESIRTNLSIAEISSLAEIAKTVDFRNSSTVVVDAWKKESLLRVSHLDIGGVRAFILVPRTGNWNEVREDAGNIFDQETRKRRIEAIAHEKPSILILSDPKLRGAAVSFAKTLEETLPVYDVNVKTTVALEKNEKSAIIDRTSLSKPYTLDSLMSTFSLRKESSNPDLVALDEKTDFVIIVGNDMSEANSSDMTLEKAGSSLDDDPFSELFPAQEKP